MASSGEDRGRNEHAHDRGSGSMRLLSDSPFPFEALMKATLDISEDGPVKRLRVSWRIFIELNKHTTLHKCDGGALDFNGVPVICDPLLPEDAIVKEFGGNLE